MEHPDLDMNKRYICVNGNNGDIVLMTIKMVTIKMVMMAKMAMFCSSPSIATVICGKVKNPSGAVWSSMER